MVDRQLDLAATGPQWLAEERVAECVWKTLVFLMDFVIRGNGAFG